MATLLQLLVRLYQRLLRPVLPPMCRFTPSCSDYALEALQHHGALRGGSLAVRRICRCHPWNPGGFDPVPPSIAPSQPAPLPRADEGRHSAENP